MPKLTKRVVDTLRADPTRRRFVADADLAGFALRISPSGTKTYVVEYRPGAGGRGTLKRRMTIGRHGSPWTPETARAEARRILNLVAAGEDPAAEKADARKGPDPAKTFEAVVRRYLELHGRRLRRSTRRDYGYVFERDLIPAWGQRAVEAVTRREVTTLVDGIEARAPVRARLAFAVTRSFFGWCVEKGYRDDNPCDGLKGPAAPKPRDRVLDDDEVALVWQASFALGFPFGPAIRLLIVTAARRDEVGGLAWAELDLAKKLWRLPAARAKNETGHDLDLHDLAVAELEPIPATGPLVFTTTAKPLQGWSKAKLRLDDEITRQRRDEAEPKRAGEKLTEDDRRAYELPAWRIHDLRRTAATGMAAAGFAPQVVERVLNHKSGVRGGLVGVYQRHEYRDERKAASLAWANHVERIVTGEADTGNVIELNLRGA